ncbi:MAG: PEP-CTERM sorting domain-containing protein [Candidatus Eisenbacteria bacterium]|nr:PEP-CTERM sorting domain-containing protein [Candidatus Eisenbacteria bacterium]
MSASVARRGCMMSTRIIAALAVVCLLGLALPQSQATIWEISKDWTLYGNLDQDDIPGIGAVACGPTAAVNSFVYLENAYPWIYDNSLTPVQFNNHDGDEDIDAYDDMIDAALTLAGPNYMNTQPPGGTFHDSFIWGKYSYIEGLVPGMTRYEAQDFWNWQNHVRPAWVDPVIPTWDFIYGELFDCEDVEILINGVYEDYGHYLTLTSFHWDDVANSGWMDYIDPATGTLRVTNIWLDDATGQIRTDYWGEGYQVSWISMAVSESPIPEPGTLLLLVCSGVVAGACLRRRRHR